MDNTISTPLYRQLENTIRQDIDTGKFPPSSQLPTENELSDIYHVSRVTVRKALSVLSDAGYLERHSGKGTFVAEKKMQRSISQVLGFTEMCKILHTSAGAKTLKIALEDPTEKEIEQLSIQPSEQIITLERLRYSDGKPVLLELNKFPESFSFLFGVNLTDASLYEALRKYDIIFVQSRKTIDIVFATAAESKLLDIPKGHPLLRIRSVVSNSDGSVTSISQQLCIGDKFKFLV